MKTWNFYRLSDGVFDGRSFSSHDESALAINTPAGYGARPDVSDWRSQRVDLATGLVTDYQPPAPDDDHEWDATTKRNVLKPAVAERRRRQQQAQARIDQLEAQQPRAMRELALDPGDARATERLRAIDDEIKELRDDL